MIGKSLGRYRIVETIGEGGMGTVYRARDERLKRDVALKVLPGGTLDDDVARKRLRKEALNLSRLSHPRIATVHDFDSHGGVDFVVMELVEGATLERMLAGDDVPEEEVVRLGGQLAEGLAAAHQKGVVHRDLKPGNLRLTPEGDLKILDFGIARTIRPVGGETVTRSLTQSPQVAGTLPYMAPEQLRGKPVDHRMDIYAAGAVLYELATGRTVFSQMKAMDLVDAIWHQAPVSPRAYDPSLSPELERIILKCLDKNPERRYQSARDLQVDLERLRQPRTDEMRLARTVPIWRRLWASSGRRWALGASLGIGIGAVIAVLLITQDRPALSFSAREWVLITDFDNRTDDPVFDNSLLTAFTVSLEQSVYANVFPRARRNDVLRRMGREPAQTIDEELGREICLRENIRGLVSGGIDRIRDQYLVTAKLINPETGEAVRSYMERVEGQERVLDALETIAVQLRRDLGESLASIEIRNKPLQRVTTPSMQALKNYTDAAELWDRGRYREGIERYEAAVEEDPDFAMAHAALGICYLSYVAYHQDKGETHFRRALELTDRITDRERLFVEAEYESTLGDDKKAMYLFTLYLETYPDSWAVRFNLAGMLRAHHRYEEAAQHYETLLEINPTMAATQVNLATCYAGLGRDMDARAHYERAFELEPDWLTTTNLIQEYGFTLVRVGDTTKAREIFTVAMESANLESSGHRSLALLAVYQGRYDLARHHLDEAILITQAGGWPVSEARNRLIRSIVCEHLGDRRGRIGEFGRIYAVLDSSATPTWFIARAGVEFARSGELEMAESALAIARKRCDPKRWDQASELHRLEGELELARENHDRALRLLRLAHGENEWELGLESLAHGYLTAGQQDEAIRFYESFLRHPQVPLGWELQLRWLEAHYTLARLYRSQGETAKARERVEQLLALWAGADPDLPLYRKARKLQEELETEGS